MSSLLELIDAEIDRLQQVKAVLAQATGISGNIAKAGKKPGGPSSKPTKRILSPEARKKIADAQKRRWAAARRAKG